MIRKYFKNFQFFEHAEVILGQKFLSVVDYQIKPVRMKESAVLTGNLTLNLLV
jgi:hypothetical protein